MVYRKESNKKHVFFSTDAPIKKTSSPRYINIDVGCANTGNLQEIEGAGKV